MNKYKACNAIALHTTFIIISILLLVHKFPLISSLNQKVLDSIKFAEDSYPFTMYLNFDKALLGLIVFLCFGFTIHKKITYQKVIKITFFNTLLCSSVIFSIALLIDAIRWDPKFPSESFIFLLNNLFIVCVAEEAFFRRYIQGHLQEVFKFRFGPLLALLLASVVFGLAHYKGGFQMVAFASLAGLFYGVSFLKTGRLEASVLTHFGFNIIHFFFFSYPFLDN